MQDSVLDLTIVVPVYNPDERLVKMIKELRRRGFHDIIVVNDGSDEEHGMPLEQVEGDATVIHYGKNRGKGKAMKIAFSFCKENRKKSQGIIIADWENQHHPDDVYACGKTLLENNGHLILGCRDFRGDDVPLRSKLENGIRKGALFVFRGIRVSDAQAGLCAFGMNWLARLMEEKGERSEYENNVLLEVKDLDMPIIEIPIRTLSA